MMRPVLRARGWCRGFELGGTRRYITNRRGRGNVGIPEGFPKSVGRVGSRIQRLSMLPILCHFHGLRLARQCWMNIYAHATLHKAPNPNGSLIAIRCL